MSYMCQHITASNNDVLTFILVFTYNYEVNDMKTAIRSKWFNYCTDVLHLLTCKQQRCLNI